MACIALLLACLFPLGTFARISCSAVIAGTSSGGVGFVAIEQDANGWNATVGKWDPDNPSEEPLGDSQLFVDIDVQGGGTVAFWYLLKTVDIAQYDWMDVYLDVPGGQYTVISNLGGPAPVNQTYYETGWVWRAVDLAQWAGQQVRLVVSVHQDGFVDQTQATVYALNIWPCPVGPPTPITDPDAQQLESDPVDETRLTQYMQSKLGCLRNAVQQAGGTIQITSAWRSQAYQLHLYETRARWKALMTNRDPLCATLKQEALNHMLQHGLDTTLKRPVAKTAGHHPLGIAIDATWTAGIDIDALAAGCEMRRPFFDCSEAGKARGRCDTVHIELLESLWEQP